MNKYYVYELRDPRKQDCPFYIGKGCGRRAERHVEAIRNGRKSENPHKDHTIAAILQEGLEPIIHFVQINMAEDAAYKLECQLIKQHGLRTTGGLLTNICIEAKPPSWLGKKKTPEHNAKMSRIFSGEGNPMYGKTWTEEQRKIASAHRKGKPSPRKGKTYGHKHTEQFKKAASERQTGKNNSFSGKTHTIETKQKLSERGRGRKCPQSAETTRKIIETRRRNIIERFEKSVMLLAQTEQPITKRTVTDASGLSDKTVRRYWFLIDQRSTSA